MKLENIDYEILCKLTGLPRDAFPIVEPDPRETKVDDEDPVEDKEDAT